MENHKKWMAGLCYVVLLLFCVRPVYQQCERVCCVYRMIKIWSLAASKFAIFRAAQMEAKAVGVVLTNRFDECNVIPKDLVSPNKISISCPLGGEYEKFTFWTGPKCPNGHTYGHEWAFGFIAKKIRFKANLRDSLHDVSPAVRYKAILQAEQESSRESAIMASLREIAIYDKDSGLRDRARMALKTIGTRNSLAPCN